MTSEDIRTFLARLFLGKARVRSFVPGGRSVVLHTAEREIETRPLRSPERVLGSTLYGASMSAVAKGFRMRDANIAAIRGKIGGGTDFFAKKIIAKGARIVRDHEVFSRSVSLITVNRNKGLRRISPLPHEVRNKLPWFRRKTPSLAAGESLLALYFPVLEDGVIKSVLNKERGTLLVWYNPRRAWKTRGLLLVRNFAPGGGLEWRWVDIE